MPILLQANKEKYRHSCKKFVKIHKQRIKIDEGTNETVKIKDLIFASTGVIGEEFPVEKIKNRLSDLVEKLRVDQNKMYWQDASAK